MANSTRRCTGCKERFKSDSMIKLPAGYFHSIECASDYAYQKQQKQKERQIAKNKRDSKAKEKARRAQHRADKEAIKPLSKLTSEAQAAFNSYIRIRDYHDPCISCGKSREVIEHEQGWKVGGCWDAGHFKTRGAKPQLRFNLWNCHKQCKSCNGGGGRFSSKAKTVDEQYEQNLKVKIGEKKVSYLNNNNDIVKFTPDYLRRIRDIFRKKARIRKKILALNSCH